MVGPRIRAGVASFAFVAALAPFALGQPRSDPNAGKTWDPITGFADGSAANDQATAGGRSNSVWSFSQPLDSDFAGGYESPATIGGIVFSRDGQRCGGMFRMVACRPPPPHQ
jgi:hypothetical protein